VNGLGPVEVVAGEGEQGQKATHVTDVGFEHRDVSDLQKKGKKVKRWLNIIKV
jgi:hypothetical protein